MNYKLLNPSKYVSAIDFQGRDVTVTIKAVRLEELEDESGGKKAKGIVSLIGTKKEWVMNVTNAEALKQMFGPDTDGWIGKRATLFPAPHTDQRTKEKGVCIRVRGSPDITKPITYMLKLKMKKPQQVTLIPTGGPTQGQRPANGSAAQRQTPPADNEPPMPDEPPPDMLLPGQPGYEAQS